MENELIRYFLTQGPFAALFIWLLFTTRKENRERERQLLEESKDREARLHELLEKFSTKYDVIIDELRGLKEKFPK